MTLHITWPTTVLHSLPAHENAPAQLWDSTGHYCAIDDYRLVWCPFKSNVQELPRGYGMGADESCQSIVVHGMDEFFG